MPPVKPRFTLMVAFALFGGACQSFADRSSLDTRRVIELGSQRVLFANSDPDLAWASVLAVLEGNGYTVSFPYPGRFYARVASKGVAGAWIDAQLEVPGATLFVYAVSTGDVFEEAFYGLRREVDHLASAIDTDHMQRRQELAMRDGDVAALAESSPPGQRTDPGERTRQVAEEEWRAIDEGAVQEARRLEASRALEERPGTRITEGEVPLPPAGDVGGEDDVRADASPMLRQPEHRVAPDPSERQEQMISEVPLETDAALVSASLRDGTLLIRYRVSREGFEMTSRGASAIETTWIIVLGNVFNHARRIFERHPDAARIVWEWVLPIHTRRRDQFGNLISEAVRHEVLSTAELTREKAALLNWRYVMDQGFPYFTARTRRFLSSSRVRVPRSLESALDEMNERF